MDDVVMAPHVAILSREFIFREPSHSHQVRERALLSFHKVHTQSNVKKYENELRLEDERNKWTFYSCVLEVGARGWIPPSLVSSLNKLGLPAVNNLSKDLSLLAMKSSYIIWVNRFNREFSPWRLKVQRSCPLRWLQALRLA